MTDAQIKSLQVDLPKELHRELRTLSIEGGIPIQSIIVEAIQAKLAPAQMQPAQSMFPDMSEFSALMDEIQLADPPAADTMVPTVEVPDVRPLSERVPSIDPVSVPLSQSGCVVIPPMEPARADPVPVPHPVQANQAEPVPVSQPQQPAFEASDVVGVALGIVDLAHRFEAYAQAGMVMPYSQYLERVANYNAILATGDQSYAQALQQERYLLDHVLVFMDDDGSLLEDVVFTDQGPHPVYDTWDHIHVRPYVDMAAGYPILRFDGSAILPEHTVFSECIDPFPVKSMPQA